MMINLSAAPSLAIASLLAAPPVSAGDLNALTPSERAAGWVLLFDGESTASWRAYQKDAFPSDGWKVEDGSLRVVANGGGGDIVTKDQFENFELTLEFKPAARANSGIMYRVTEEHSTPWQTGPEFQILDDAGSNLAADDIHSSGGLYDITAPPANKPFKANDWNAVRIRLVNGVVEHWLNDTLVVKENLDSEEFASKIAASKFASYDGFGVRHSGHLCLQDHGNDVWFRNIKVRDLDADLPNEVKLFKNGQSVEVTHFYPGSTDMSFYVDEADGLLKTRGQPIGYVRSNDDFTNYVLKLEWRFNPVTKQEGNGGVLLRMIGEDKVWPKSVEAQLHSKNAGDFWNIDNFDMKVAEDRTSGRNTKKTHFAENPVGEWNEYEIIVDRGLVILKVNGQELNRAWDVAEIPGKICLQSEGSEMHFRNIRLAPIVYSESD